MLQAKQEVILAFRKLILKADVTHKSEDYIMIFSGVVLFDESLKLRINICKDLSKKIP